MTAPIVRGVHEAQDGTLWLGLSGGGLNALDPVDGSRCAPTGRGLRRGPLVGRRLERHDGRGRHRLGRDARRRPEPGRPADGHRPRLPRCARTTRRRSLPTSSASSSRAATARSGSARPGAASAGSTAGRSAFDCFRNDPDDPSSLSSDVVRAVHEGPSGTLWVGTDRGINRLDRATRPLHALPRRPFAPRRRPASPASTASGRRPTGFSGPERPAASSGSTPQRVP